MEHDDLHARCDQLERSIAQTRQRMREALDAAHAATERELSALREQVATLQSMCANQEDALLWFARREVERMETLPDAATVPLLVFEALVMVRIAA
jgi:predicted  nucleic acid-binding Zn-ribbon protein